MFIVDNLNRNISGLMVKTFEGISSATLSTGVIRVIATVMQEYSKHIHTLVPKNCLFYLFDTTQMFKQNTVQPTKHF